MGALLLRADISSASHPVSNPPSPSARPRALAAVDAARVTDTLHVEDVGTPESERLRQRLYDVEAELEATRRAWESSDSRRPVALFVFWTAFAWTLWLRYASYKTQAFQGYNTGEWLINYKGGFVRRGLIGQVIYFFAKYVLHVNAAAIVFTIQIGAYLVVGVLMTRLLLRKRSPWIPWMLLAPAGLLFVALDMDGGFRKELLLFVPVLCLASAVRCRPAARRVWVAVAVALYVVGIFSWEANIFFLPFVLVLLHAALPVRHARRITAIVAGVSIACTLVVAAFPGNAKVTAAITNSLPDVGVPKSAGSGGIRSLEQPFMDAVHATFKYSSLHDPKHYFYSFLLCLVPFAACGWLRKYKWFFAVSLLWSLPQYLVACDYGRWIHAFVTCMSIHWLVMTEDEPRARRVFRLPPWCFDVVLVVWCTCWSMQHCDDGFRRTATLLDRIHTLVAPG